MCLSEATCLSADCSFSKLALKKYNSACLSRRKRTSSSCETTITHSLFGKSFKKGLVHSEVLEEIEKHVDKGLIQSKITEGNSIVTVFDPGTKHILLSKGSRLESDI